MWSKSCFLLPVRNYCIAMRLFSLIFVLFICFCESVDKSNFKTCNQSGFCRRQKEYVAGSDECAINSESIEILTTKLVAHIFCKKNNVYFVLELIKQTGRVFRLKISEKSPTRPRFQPQVGDVLISEPSESDLHINVDNNVILIKGTNEEKAILYLDPFKLDLYLKDIPLISVNSQNLFKFEHTRNKSDVSAAENSTENDTKVEQNFNEDFKGHIDSKPHGFTSVGLDISFPGFQYVYGIPEHADKFALRNTDSTDPYRLYNADVFEYELNNPMALYGSVPLMWAHNVNHTVGIFWLNPSETWIDIHSSLESLNTFEKILNFVKRSEVKAKVDTHWMSESGIIDVFFFLGESPSEVMHEYGKLTGTTPLPPLFSLAYHQCRWNYNDQSDVINVDRLMDENDIPFDVIWLDIEHTEEKKYFTWDKTKFSNPNEMVDHLDAKSRKLVTVIDPHIKRVPGWSIYDEGLSKDLYIKKSDGSTVYEGWCWPGSSVWPDFNSEAVRHWWANLFLTYEGSRANNTFTWNDMGEPSVFNGPEVTMEKDAIHFGNWEHREIHNLYGLQVHRASWEGQLLRSQNTERPFVLTRAFFAGSQKYAAVWTGDNAAAWDHLKATTPMLLSLSVVGIPFCGADVGGFFGNPDNELLTRWYQAAAFHPFFRAHAHIDTKRREPYLLPSDNVKIIRSAIQERYKLLPYWYTLFYQSETSNAPVMAPMWYYYASDSNNFHIDDQFMVGPAILVKPVTESGLTSMDVYLPPGMWYLQSGWTLYHGGRTVNLPITLSSIPVFYNGGHILPRKERVRRSSYLSRYDPYTFLVFLNDDENAYGNLYIDDLHSLNYKRGEYEYYSLVFSKFQLSVSKTHKDNLVNLRPKLERVVICGLKNKPTRITLIDKNADKKIDLEYFYMSERLLLVIRNPGVVIDDSWSIRLEYQKEDL